MQLCRGADQDVDALERLDAPDEEDDPLAVTKPQPLARRFLVSRHEQVQVHPARNDRSEEHTSELQSLMRISYAVFCLKKKTTKNTKKKKIDSMQIRDYDKHTGLLSTYNNSIKEHV